MPSNQSLSNFDEEIGELFHDVMSFLRDTLPESEHEKTQDQEDFCELMMGEDLSIVVGITRDYFYEKCLEFGIIYPQDLHLRILRHSS